MKLRRIICSLFISLSLLSFPISAKEPITVRLNGSDTKMDALLIDSTTYVPFDTANTELSFGKARIMGDENKMQAVTADAVVCASVGDFFIEAHGRYIGAGENITVNGRLYVPIRSLARVYNTNVVWDHQSRSVDLYGSGEIFTHADNYYDSDKLLWLSRIIDAEANGESLTGKVLVGNVVLNRVASGEFPNTVYGVIFDREYGVQFTPTVNGTIYNSPTEESILAAKLCLDGYCISRSALYFLNPRTAVSSWIPNNRPYLMSVGNHDFYA